MPPTMIYATISCGLLVFLCCPTSKLSTRLRLGLLILALVVVTMPPTGFNLTLALRGTVGDLSIFTTFWLLSSAAERIRPGCTALRADQRRFAAGTVLLTAMILYPTAMGLTQYDVYRLGYGMGLVIACLAAVFLFAYLGQIFTATALTAALAAYALRLLESSNFWDYLIDPCLVVYAIIVLIRRPAVDRPSPGVNTEQPALTR